MDAATFSKTGSKSSSSVKLDKDIFKIEVRNHTLLKQAYLTNLDNTRENSAKTLTRSFTRGGGKKPWRQKGTGRARAGSIRSPLWTGGAITFGPTGDENYGKKLPKKAKRLALRQALTLAAKSGKISVIDDFSAKDGKTKEAAELLNKVTSERPVSLVLSEISQENKRALNNISDVNVVNAKYLSVNTVLDSRQLVFSKKALEDITTVLKGDR